MDMVVVVHPTLDEYSSQVNAMANKYGLDNWLELFNNPETMNDEDREDFSFITMAVGDDLIHREFESLLGTSPGGDLDELSIEPGCFPGSIVWSGVHIDGLGVRRPSSKNPIHVSLFRS